MQFKAIHYYVCAVYALALLSLRFVAWNELGFLSPSHIAAFLLLVGFGLISERLSVGMTFVPRGATHSIIFIPLSATALLFGPAAPVIFMVLTGGITELFLRKKERIRALFNIGQYALATGTAGLAFTATGGHASIGQVEFSLQLMPLFAFLVVLMSINHAAVALAIAVDQALPFRKVWQKFIGPAGVNAFYDLLISPVALVIAFLHHEAGLIGMGITLFPLLFIRHAYLNTYRLGQSNRDLLKVLVKAIEVRDEYTSGHSQRVAAFAGRIAREMKLGTGATEAIEMAALLHDIGKIDVIYSEILRKPDSLTEEERLIIESHVTKGVELLTSLASVPEGVIKAVRHHHERWDGTGYPDRMAGDQIPLGARIIKVCDAVDAMLSDRPYRSALSLHEVREQLEKYAGREFDSTIVACVLTSSLLAEHASASEPARSSEMPERDSDASLAVASRGKAFRPQRQYSVGFPQVPMRQ